MLFDNIKTFLAVLNTYNFFPVNKTTKKLFSKRKHWPKNHLIKTASPPYIFIDRAITYLSISSWSIEFDPVSRVNCAV